MSNWGVYLVDTLRIESDTPECIDIASLGRKSTHIMDIEATSNRHDDCLGRRVMSSKVLLVDGQLPVDSVCTHGEVSNVGYHANEVSGKCVGNSEFLSHVFGWLANGNAI